MDEPNHYRRDVVVQCAKCGKWHRLDGGDVSPPVTELGRCSICGWPLERCETCGWPFAMGQRCPRCDETPETEEVLYYLRVLDGRVGVDPRPDHTLVTFRVPWRRRLELAKWLRLLADSIDGGE